jgi:ATP-dependent RNA helicase DeaD
MNSLKGNKALEIMPIYGGQSIELQIRHLRQGVDIVAGTPGRVLDLLKRGELSLEHVRFAVLDEADEMLNMGFIEDIETILSKTAVEKRMLLFSATMPQQVVGIAKKFMRNYIVLTAAKQQITANLTEQIYFEVRREDKFEAITRIIDAEDEFYALLFCRTKNDVDELTEKLSRRGYGVEALHGDISQAQRTKVIERFKRKAFNILIATDVAARGIDIVNLTHVINFSIPQEPESYIHRIGRTGRAGKTGTAITFVTPAEYRKLTYIEKLTQTTISKRKLPSLNDIVNRKKARMQQKLQDVMEQEGHLGYIEFARQLLDDKDPENTIAALLKMIYKDDLLKDNSRDSARDNGRDQDGQQQVDVQGKTRLFIALGKKDGNNPRSIADLLWDTAKIKNHKVGNIQCFDTFTFVTVPFREAEIILETFQRKAKGRQSLVAIAKPENNDASDAQQDSQKPQNSYKKRKKY